MLDTLTLLRIGAQTSTISRGRVSDEGGLCRVCSKVAGAVSSGRAESESMPVIASALLSVVQPKQAKSILVMDLCC